MHWELWKPKEQERTWDCCPFKRNTSRLQRRCWENPFIRNKHVSSDFFSLLKTTVHSPPCNAKEEVGLSAASELRACAVYTPVGGEIGSEMAEIHVTHKAARRLACDNHWAGNTNAWWELKYWWICSTDCLHQTNLTAFFQWGPTTETLEPLI